MPRAHKQADLLTAKRKRVRRAINSLKKSITDTMPESEANARRAYIQRLETQLKNTYVGRIRNAAMRDELYQRANETADRLVQQVCEVRGAKGVRGSVPVRSISSVRKCVWRPKECRVRWVTLDGKKSRYFGDTHKTYGRNRTFRRTNDWKPS